MAILPVAFCHYVDEASRIDGQLDEDIWLLPPSIPFFVRPQVRWIPEAQTQVYASYDSKCFNIAFRCFEDAPERIERRAGPPAADKLFHDDLVGFRFLPENAPPATRPFHFIMTASGEILLQSENGKFEKQSGLACQVQVGIDDWSVEGQIPFDSLNIECPQFEQRWGFSAYRQRVGARWERSGWVEVGRGPYGETMPGWMVFKNLDQTSEKGKAIEPYLRRFGELLEIRIRQAVEARNALPADACPVTRHRINLMIRSFLSIKNDMLHPFHPDALRHYSQTLQFNVGRLDELIENLRQGEDPHTAPDGYVFLGTPLPTDRAMHAFALIQGRGYESTASHPLIIMLNGFSEDWIADSRAFLDLAWPPELDFLMAFPSGVGTSRSYRLASEDEVFGVIREMRRRFSVDPQRTILIGLGEGAEAAYRLASRFPQVFDSVAIGGAVSEHTLFQSAPPPRLFHWEEAQKEWIGPLEKIERTLRDEFAKMPTAGAQALTPEFLQMITSQRPHPRSDLELLAPSMRYRRGEWACIDRPIDFSKMARLRLVVMEDGSVTAETGNVGAFTIYPQEGPFVPGQTIRVESRKESIAVGSFGHSIHCELMPPPKGPLLKTADLSGPIDEAFHGALIYVYGTGGSGEQTAMLRQAALQACRWPKYDLRIPVKSDEEISEEDLANAHLHLFGGMLNLLHKKMASRLPVSSRNGKILVGRENFADPDAVCQYIYPNPLNPNRYILTHHSNSDRGWFYRGWFPKKEQPEPLPDLWVARLGDNPRIDMVGVEPVYRRKLWFNALWHLGQ